MDINLCDFVENYVSLNHRILQYKQNFIVKQKFAGIYYCSWDQQQKPWNLFAS